MHSEEVLDVEIEICKDCHLHTYCSHHDESKYIEHFERFRAKLLSHLPNAIIKKNEIPPGFKKLYNKSVVSQNKYYNEETQELIHYPRFGAFQVLVDGMLIFSKLKSSLWPSHDRLVRLILDIAKEKQEGGDIEKFSLSYRLAHGGDEEFIDTYKAEIARSQVHKRSSSNQHHFNNHSNYPESPIRRHFITRKVQTGGSWRKKQKSKQKENGNKMDLFYSRDRPVSREKWSRKKQSSHNHDEELQILTASDWKFEHKASPPIRKNKKLVIRSDVFNLEPIGSKSAGPNKFTNNKLRKKSSQTSDKLEVQEKNQMHESPKEADANQTNHPIKAFKRKSDQEASGSDYKRNQIIARQTKNHQETSEFILSDNQEKYRDNKQEQASEDGRPVVKKSNHIINDANQKTSDQMRQEARTQQRQGALDDDKFSEGEGRNQSKTQVRKDNFGQQGKKQENPNEFEVQEQYYDRNFEDESKGIIEDSSDKNQQKELQKNKDMDKQYNYQFELVEQIGEEAAKNVSEPTKKETIDHQKQVARKSQKDSEDVNVNSINKEGDQELQASGKNRADKDEKSITRNELSLKQQNQQKGQIEQLAVSNQVQRSARPNAKSQVSEKEMEDQKSAVKDGIKKQEKKDSEISVQDKNQEKINQKTYKQAKDKAMDEVIDDLKDEIKEQVKEEAKDGVQGEIKDDKKNKVKDEVKDDVKDEVQEESLDEIKDEAQDGAKDKVKDEAKNDIKDEVQDKSLDEVKDEVKDDSIE